jgi:hypothetical protein
MRETWDTQSLFCGGSSCAVQTFCQEVSVPSRRVSPKTSWHHPSARATNRTGADRSPSFFAPRERRYSKMVAKAGIERYKVGLWDPHGQTAITDSRQHTGDNGRAPNKRTNGDRHQTDDKGGSSGRRHHTGNNGSGFSKGGGRPATTAGSSKRANGNPSTNGPQRRPSNKRANGDPQRHRHRAGNNGNASPYIAVLDLAARSCVLRACAKLAGARQVIRVCGCVRVCAKLAGARQVIRVCGCVRVCAKLAGARQVTPCYSIPHGFSVAGRCNPKLPPRSFSNLQVMSTRAPRDFCVPQRI